MREGFTGNFCAFPKVKDVLSKPIDKVAAIDKKAPYLAELRIDAVLIYT